MDHLETTITIIINHGRTFSVPSHKIKLQMVLSSSLIKVGGGFGKTRNRNTRCEMPKDFVMILRPMGVISLFDQERRETFNLDNSGEN